MSVGAAYLAAYVFLLGHVDPKWGGPWDNFVFVLQLLVISAAVETVIFVALGALVGRRGLASWKSKWAAALVIAIANLVIWPPTAVKAELMAVLVAALGLLGGAFVAFLAARREAQRVGEPRAAAGA